MATPIKNRFLVPLMGVTVFILGACLFWYLEGPQLHHSKSLKPIVRAENATHVSLRTSIKEARNLIVGGEAASAEDGYGFFANLLGDGGCGGSLIAPNIVLTAGHCWRSRLKEIAIGPVYEENSQKDTRQRVGKIEEIRIHPDYHLSQDLDYDFLLVRLSSIEVRKVANRKSPSEIPPWRDGHEPSDTKANTNQEYTLPITIGQETHDGSLPELQYIELNADANVPKDYTSLRLIGMGYTSSSNQVTGLQHVIDNDFQKIPTSVCNGLDAFDGKIHEETTFCAGSMDGDIDACRGDSGSPLFYYDDDTKRPVQVGLVSWGKPCFDQNLPSAYARISVAYDWIRDVVCGNWKDASANESIDDWFLCDGYEYDMWRTQYPVGGDYNIHNTDVIDDNSVACNVQTEVPFEFQMTADAYGWEVFWELSLGSHTSEDNNATRIVGDQLWNDHETRFYRFCLPRESGQCYTLNINDRLFDGVSHQSKASESEETTVNPAGYGIRFGNAELNEDFSFPNYGKAASFVLCPAAANSGEEDSVLRITDSPTAQPSEAPSVAPTPLAVALQNAMEDFSDPLTNPYTAGFSSRSKLKDGSRNDLVPGWLQP